MEKPDLNVLEIFRPEREMPRRETICSECPLRGKPECPGDGLDGFLRDGRMCHHAVLIIEAHHRRERVRQLLRDFPLPARMAGATLYNPRQRQTYQAADLIAWAEMPQATRQNVLLRGASGAGKTHLAVALCRELHRRGEAALFVCVPDLLYRMREAMQYPEQAAELADAVESADVLVLDDLGAERSTEYAEEQIFRIVNARYNAARPLVVTTNIADTAGQSLHARVVRRLMDGAFILDF